MTVCTAWPRLMDPEQAKAYVGGEGILEELKKLGLIKPKIDKRGCVRYDRVKLDAAVDAYKPLEA